MQSSNNTEASNKTTSSHDGSTRAAVKPEKKPRKSLTFLWMLTWRVLLALVLVPAEAIILCIPLVFLVNFFMLFRAVETSNTLGMWLVAIQIALVLVFLECMTRK